MSNLSTKLEVYRCIKCYSTYRNQQAADKCCVKELIRNCTRCSRPIEDTHYEWKAHCEECEEYKRVKQTEILSALPDTGFLYHDKADMYISVRNFEEDLLDAIDEEYIYEEISDGYIYATKFQPFNIDPDCIMDKLYEEFPETEDFDGLHKVLDAVHEFNVNNKFDGVWLPDYSKIYIYDQKLFERFLKENSIIIDPLEYVLGVTRKFKLKELEKCL